MDGLQLLPLRIRQRAKDTFTYNITFNTLAASGTSVGTANIQGDSDFVWTKGTMIVTGASGLVFTSSAAAPFLIEVTDTGSGRQLQDSPTHVSNLFGTAQLPFELNYPKEFKASGQISVKIQNQDPANAFVVRLAFHGFKMFDQMEK